VLLLTPLNNMQYDSVGHHHSTIWVVHNATAMSSTLVMMIFFLVKEMTP